MFPFQFIKGNNKSAIILICDHASPGLPKAYGTLGLDEQEFTRHIAYDIGVYEVTKRLAERCGYDAIFANFSRLLIDPNRAEQDPTIVMRISDGTIIPGNAYIDDEEIEKRKTNFYRPYHNKITELINGYLNRGIAPVLFSIHSFTDEFHGVKRPWNASVLWFADPRFARLLIDGLEQYTKLVIGENVPYKGEIEGDTMNYHGLKRGLSHALLEIRQDQLLDDKGINDWVLRIEKILNEALDNDYLYVEKNY